MCFSRNFYVLNLFFFLVLTVVTLLPQSGCGAVVADYHFDGCRWIGAAGEVVDSSGNVHPGTAKSDANTVVNDGIGGVCHSATFDGHGDYIDVALSSGLVSDGAFTASVWFKTDLTENYDGVITKLNAVGSQGGSGRGWNININHGTIMSLLSDSSGHYQYLSSGQAVQSGVWYHVVLVHQGNNSNIIYVNGMARGSLNHGVAQGNNNNLFQVGKFYSNANTLLFNGSIDEVKLFDDALAVTAVHDMYVNEQAGKNYDGSSRTCPNCAVVPTPIIDYRFDECIWNGTTGEIENQNGNTYTATAVGSAVTDDTDAPLCHCGVFAADGDYIQVDSSLTPLLANASLSFWIKTQQSGSDIVAQAPGITGRVGENDTISWGWLDRAGHVGVSVGADATTKSVTSINDGTWHHVVLTRDKEHGKYTIYVNNHLDQVGDISTIDIGHNFTSIGRIENTDNNKFSNYLHAELDEVKVFSKVLIAEEVDVLYRNESRGYNFDGFLRNCNSCVPIPSPTAYYKLDECFLDGTAGEVKDSSGNDNNGISIAETTTVENDGSGGLCRSGVFDGDGDRIEIADNPQLHPAGGFSVSVWFKEGTLGNYYNGIISKLTNVNGISKPGRGWNLNVDNHAGRNVISSLMADSDGHFKYLVGTTRVQPGAWYHVILVHQEDNNNYLYVNGRLENHNIQAIAIADNPLQMGTFYTNSSSLYFEGHIDDVIVFDSALGESQVADMFRYYRAGNNYDNSPASCSVCALAEWRFDGCDLGAIIIDSGGSSFDGVPQGEILSQKGHLCQGGYFAGTDSYITIDDEDEFDDVDKLSLSMWFNAEQIHQDNGTNARGLISKRRSAGNNEAFGVFFWNGHGNKLWFDIDNTNNRFSSTTSFDENKWYAVSVVFDGSLPENERVKLYVDGVLDSTHGESSQRIPGYNSNLYIGNLYYGTSQLKVFKGMIDEVKIISAALSVAEINMLYTETRPGCSMCGPDHIRIEHTGVGLTCQRSEITLRGCVDATCSSEYPDPLTVTMTAVTANPPVWIGGDTLTFTGHQTIQLGQAMPGPLTLGLVDPNPAPVNGYMCFDSGVEGDCDIVFYDSGFIFDVPDLTSCRTSANISIQAVRTDETSHICVADGGFASTNKSVNFWSSYANPVTGTEQVSLGGTNVATGSPGTGISLNFDATATANFTVNYPDAGQIQLNARYDGIGTEEAGLVMLGSDSFITRPVGLCVYSDDASTDCASANGSCSAFKKVDESFNLKIKGVCWESSGDTDFCSGNPITSNFQLASIPITHNLIAPSTAGVSAGNIGVSSIDILAVDNGEHVIANQTVSEVGVYTFTATPPGYFGSALPVATSATIGRFTPDHFVTSITNNGVLQDGCTGFTYSGQSFSYNSPNFPEMLITAVGSAGNTTVNYRDDFVKLTAPATQINMPTVTNDTSNLGNDGSTLLDLIWGPATSSLVQNNNGALDFSLGADQFTYTREINALVAPFTSDIQLPVNSVTDSDGIIATDLPRNFLPTGTEIRYGQMQLQNAYGPETLPLTTPVLTEYYNGTTYVLNALDSCTAYDSSNLLLDNYQGNLTAGETISSGSGTLLSGIGNAFSLSAPGVGNDGSVDLTLDLSQATGANMEWLRPNGIDPTAKVTFGIFKGNNHLIYMRESIW